MFPVKACGSAQEWLNNSLQDLVICLSSFGEMKLCSSRISRHAAIDIEYGRILSSSQVSRDGHTGQKRDIFPAPYGKVFS